MTALADVDRLLELAADVDRRAATRGQQVSPEWAERLAEYDRYIAAEAAALRRSYEERAPSRRQYAALMLSPTITVYEALIRGFEVPTRVLDVETLREMAA